MLKVAVAGLGFMGKTHIGIYRKLDDVELSAICDASEERLNITNLEGGGNIKTSSEAIDLSRVSKYTDYGTMLRDGGFDFVDICLPTFLHVDHTVAAMDAGYNVFLEKPMALDAGGVDRILKKVRDTGKILSVGQCLRYWPAYAEVKRILDEGSYGRVRYAEYARLSAKPGWTWNNWITDGRRSGEAALDLHIHDADMVLYLFGLPKSLRSTGIFEKNGGISHITTTYQYGDGLVINSTGGWICSSSYGFNMRAFYILEGATIELDFTKDPVLTVYPEGGEKYSPELPPDDGYYYELKDFTEGLERGRLSGIVTPESAAEAVRLCLREIQSAEENREIEICG